MGKLKGVFKGKSRLGTFGRSFVILVACLFVLEGCGAAMAGVDDTINGLVGKQNQWFFTHQPFHFYSFSAPRELEIQLEDIINPSLHTTWTVFSIPGLGPVDSCESRGFGLPYGVELTNSEYAKRLGNNDDGSIPLPQPDTDGLYKNGISTSQTVVLCDRDNQWVAEVHEEDITVYMTPVHLEYLADGVHQKIVHDKGTADATIDVNAIDQKSKAAPSPSAKFPGN